MYVPCVVTLERTPTPITGIYESARIVIKPGTRPHGARPGRSPVKDDKLQKEGKTRVAWRKLRRASVRQAARELAEALANVEGLQRLRGVSDEAWQEAVDAEGLAEQG